MIKKILALIACLPILLGSTSGAAAANHAMRAMEATRSSSSNSITPSTSATTSATGIYAAMGDSIAAGAGLPLVNGASSEDIRCFRSSQGYPNLVAQQTGLSLINASCGGATVGDIVTQQAVSGPNIPRQIDLAFSSGRPDLITITAGANDVKWVSFLRACQISNCATDSANKAAAALIAVMQVKMAFALQAISDRSNGAPPPTILTGYYNPISNFCKGRQNLVSNQEIDFLNTQRDALNLAIRNVVAQYSFASYASTNFNGHAVCSPDSWIQGLSDPAPLHPTARGQQNIAESVLAAMR